MCVLLKKHQLAGGLCQMECISDFFLEEMASCVLCGPFELKSHQTPAPHASSSGRLAEARRTRLNEHVDKYISLFSKPTENWLHFSDDFFFFFFHNHLQFYPKKIFHYTHKHAFAYQCMFFCFNSISYLHFYLCYLLINIF